jgi:HEXXH motif-containing protein
VSTLDGIAEAEFDALASGRGGPGAIRLLRRARESKHLIMIHAMQHLAAGVAADSVAALEHGFGLLGAARERADEDAGAVLGHPAVGGWLATCLRRLTGTADGPDPLDVELAQLGAVAATAAIRAGLEFVVTVPLRQGGVFLPGLGRAQFPGAAPGLATIRSDGARARIEAAGCSVAIPDDPSEDGEGWLGLYRLRSDVDGVVIELELDDLDPARSGHGETVTPRQGASERVAWQELLDAAWQVLVRDHPDRAAELSVGLVAIVPLVTEDAGTARTITARDAFGSMCATRSGTGLTFADSLVHEFQHSKLYALADVVPLHTAGAEPVHYSPWREDPRPLDGLLHGAYSYLGVTDFWDAQRHLLADNAERDYAEFEFCRWSRQVVAAVEVLLESGHLTDAGTRLVRGMDAASRRWQATPGPPRLRRLADLAIVDHRTRWALRNHRPDPRFVGQLADDWRSGARCSRDPREIPVTVLPSSRKQPISARLHLTHRCLQRPVVDQPSGGAEAGNADDGPNPADAALLRGELSRAAEGYLSQIAVSAGDIEAWAGLALSQYAPDFCGVDAPIWTVTEVVLAVHHELRATGHAPDVRELAAWLIPAHEPA